MDPLSVAASVAGLLSLTGKLLSILQSLPSSSDQWAIRHEIQSLDHVLLRLQRLAEDGDETSQGLLQALRGCGAALQVLESKARRPSTWLWAQMTGEIADLKQRIAAYKQDMGLILHAKELNCAGEITGTLREINSRTEQIQNERMQERTEGLRSIETALSAVRELLESGQISVERMMSDIATIGSDGENSMTREQFVIQRYLAELQSEYSAPTADFAQPAIGAEDEHSTASITVAPDSATGGGSAISGAATCALRGSGYTGQHTFQLLDLESRVVRNDAEVLCDCCDEVIAESHYHCSECRDDDFDICKGCYELGIRCYDQTHALSRREIMTEGQAKFCYELIERTAAAERAVEYFAGLAMGGQNASPEPIDNKPPQSVSRPTVMHPHELLPTTRLRIVD